MTDPFDVLSDDARRLLRRQRHPDWVPPMLATLVDEPFSRAGWIFERKFDGIRLLAFRNGRSVRLLSRNRLPADASYPGVVAALAAQPANEFVIDGEVVAYQGRTTSFALLQQRGRFAGAGGRRGMKIVFHAFDIVHVAGRDTRALTVLDRKKLLRAALQFAGPLRSTPHRPTRGEAFLDDACRKGWEGLIAKRADSTYQGRRSSDWLKLKCSMEQEFVIGGFTDPKGARVGFGALLLGYFEDGRLRYAGDVGTGFAHQTLMALRREMDSLETDRSPFTAAAGPRNGHWVRPRLVAQVAFTEWTRDGKLRHPRFKGLRNDKSAREVARE